MALLEVVRADAAHHGVEKVGVIDVHVVLPGDSMNGRDVRVSRMLIRTDLLEFAFDDREAVAVFVDSEVERFVRHEMIISGRARPVVAARRAGALLRSFTDPAGSSRK